MLKSLYSGVAGLKTHQTRMDVIGNNIANVNTYGFKASRATFKDVFYQTTSGSTDASEKNGGGNATQVGYGAMVGTIDVLHTRGGWGPTGKTMDLYVDGDGYFIAQDGTGTQMLTRVGRLDFDGAGNLVDGNKNYICGYPIKRDATGKIEYQENVPVGATAISGNVKVDFGAANGSLMNKWKIDVKTPTPAPATIAEVVISGDTITINCQATATMADVQAALQAAITADKTPTPPAVSKLPEKLIAADVLVTDGAFAGVPPAVPDPTTVVKPNTAKDPMPVSGGVDRLTGIPIIDTTGKPVRITKPGTMTDLDGDGRPDVEGTDIAEFSGIQVGADGIIFGITKDEKVIPIGQVALAKVPNPGALEMIGSSYFVEKKNTGLITYTTPGGDDVGKIQSGGLEMSNVDLSNEFADMITTQRGFQANSRIITAGDEMLQELANMKR